MLFAAVSYGRMATACSGAPRASQSRLINVLSPGREVLLCLFLWLNLSFCSMVAGAIWMTCGAVYALIRWKFVDVRRARDVEG